MYEVDRENNAETSTNRLPSIASMAPLVPQTRCDPGTPGLQRCELAMALRAPPTASNHGHDFERRQQIEIFEPFA
jgi:hypothetical protein